MSDAGAPGCGRSYARATRASWPMNPEPSPTTFTSARVTLAPETTPVSRSASVSHSGVISCGPPGIFIVFIAVLLRASELVRAERRVIRAPHRVPQLERRVRRRLGASRAHRAGRGKVAEQELRQGRDVH